MRVLVTGAKGFVGHHLVAHLVSEGDEVVAVDVECDVSDISAVSAVVRSSAPDVVYHLAAISHVGDSFADPSNVLRVNTVGTAAVLAAVREHAPQARTVLISSAEVYGVVKPEELPLSELSPTRPVSPYAASKLAAEVVALQAFRGLGQDVVVARPFNHIGPGQSPTFFVPAIATRLLRARAEGATTITVGNLNSRRDFTDVRDVVRAYRLLALRATAGEIYNIATGVDLAIADVAETLRDMIDHTITFVPDPSLLRPADVPVLRGDASKLRAITDWTPVISIDDTLRDVVAALVAAR